MRSADRQLHSRTQHPYEFSFIEKNASRTHLILFSSHQVVPRCLLVPCFVTSALVCMRLHVCVARLLRMCSIYVPLCLYVRMLFCLRCE